jgi:hypothetical protein
MFEQDAKDQAEKAGADQANVDSPKAIKGDYDVGWGRPPKQYQFQPGKSGNPRGRPPGRLNNKTLLIRLMDEGIWIHEDGKKRKVTRYEALCKAHLTKAIKGDVQSAKFILEQAAGAGFFDERNDPQFGDQRAILSRPEARPLGSEALFDNLDLNLLSKDDKIELSRIGKVIDLGGDFTALNLTDFERAREIANKGRGKDVTRRR